MKKVMLIAAVALCAMACGNKCAKCEGECQCCESKAPAEEVVVEEVAPAEDATLVDTIVAAVEEAGEAAEAVQNAIAK